MPIPVYVQSGALAVITGASGAVTIATTPAAGNFLLLHVVESGAASFPNISAVSNIQKIDGTASNVSWDEFSPMSASIGGASQGNHYTWFGRVMATGSISATVNSSGNDMYARLHEFSGVYTGTTIGSVIENLNGGAANYFGGEYDAQNGTSTSVADSIVVTGGVNRLAVNLIGIASANRAAELTDFTGETGGTWVYPVAAAGSAVGATGTEAIITADMPTAGTIDGGTDTITSSSWGVMGFALIPDGGAPPVSATPSIAWVGA